MDRFEKETTEHEDHEAVRTGPLRERLRSWQDALSKIIQDFETAEEQCTIDAESAISAGEQCDPPRMEELEAKDTKYAMSDPDMLGAWEVELKAEFNRETAKVIETTRASTRKSCELKMHRALKNQEKEIGAFFEEELAAVETEHEEKLAEELKKQEEKLTLQFDSQLDKIATLQQDYMEKLTKLIASRATGVSSQEQQKQQEKGKGQGQEHHTERAALSHQARSPPASPLASVTESKSKKASALVQPPHKKRKRTVDEEDHETTDPTPRKYPRTGHPFSFGSFFTGGAMIPSRDSLINAHPSVSVTRPVKRATTKIKHSKLGPLYGLPRW